MDHDNLKQFSEKLALDLKAKLASQPIADFVTKAKESGDDRTFEVVFSTSDEDRQGDSLDQSGWDFTYFLLNPVVLFAHNYSSFPIGIITDIEVVGNEGVAKGKFAPEGVNPDADMACALYQEKILRAVSPGYIQNDDGTRELLEVSFCPVPAGRYALSLRQVGKLGVSTRDLVTKGFFLDTNPILKLKKESAGDPCELEDGSPGILGEDPDNPGKLVCNPEKSKSEKQNNNNVDNELTKKLTAEHERHGKAVGKAIDEFGKSESEKAIEEYKDAMESEQGEHLEKCMKAIDDSYESFGREQNEKAIDEFKSEMKAEHLEHVKACEKAIDEFKSDEKEKAIDEFTKAMGAELERHEKAHMDMCKAEADKFGEDEEDGKGEKKFYAWREKGAVAEELAEDEELQQKYMKIDRACDIFYAFVSAYLDEKTTVADFDKLLDEAVGLMKNLESKAKGLLGAKMKSGRAISAKNKDAIEKVVKALEDHHTEHGKATDDVTAALKAIMASGDGGEEPSDGKKPDEKALNSRSSTSGATELESYLFNQRLARQVKTAAEDVLRQINPKVKELTSRGR